MAYETIKGLLANQAMQKMYAETPMGRQELLSKELANKLTEFQLDKLFPVQLEKMMADVDFMLARPEMQRQQLMQERDIAEQRMALEMGIQEARISAERYGIEQRRESAMEVAEEVSRRKGIPSTVIHETPAGAGAMKIIDLYEDAEGNPSDIPYSYAVDNFGNKKFIGRSGITQKPLMPESADAVSKKRDLLTGDPGWDRLKKAYKKIAEKDEKTILGNIKEDVLIEKMIAGDERVWKTIYDTGGSLINSAQIYMDSRGLRIPAYVTPAEGIKPIEPPEIVAEPKVYKTKEEVAGDPNLTREEKLAILRKQFGMK